MATTYTNATVVYDSTTGLLTKQGSGDTIAINLVKVGDGSAGSLTLDTAGGTNTTITEAGITRTDADFTVTTGTGSLIAATDIDVGTSSPLTIANTGLTRTNQNIGLSTGSGTVTASNTITVGAGTSLVVANNGISRTDADIEISPGSGNIILSSNVFVDGNLRATGDIISADSQHVLIGDAFIDLLANNSGVTPKAGGFTVQLRSRGNVESIDSFTTNAIVFDNDVSTVFSAGDILVVSGQEDPGAANNGIFVVNSVSTTTVNIKTAPAAYVPFVQNAIAAAAGVGSPVGYQVDIAVFAVSNGELYSPGPNQIPAGTFAFAKSVGTAGATESDFNATWTSLESVTVTLQAAYDGGTGVIALANNKAFEINAPAGPNTAAILLDANAASHFTVSEQDLTLSTATSGNMSVTSAGTLGISATNAITINAATTSAINIGNDTSTGTISIGTGASARTLDLGSSNTSATTNINSGTGGVTIIAASTGKIKLGDGTSTGAIEIGKESVARTIDIGNSTGASVVNVIAGSGGINIGADTGTAGLNLGTGNSARTISIGNATNTSNLINVQAKTLLTDSKGFGRLGTWASGVATGNLVYINTSGEYAKTSYNGSGQAREVVGVALASGQVHSIPGTVIPVAFKASEKPSDVPDPVGKAVFLSTTDGLASMNPVSSGGRAVRLGWVMSGTADGAGNFAVHWAPGNFYLDV